MNRVTAASTVIAMPAAAWALGRLATDLAGEMGSPGAEVESLIAPAIVAIGAATCGYLAATAAIMLAAALTGTIPRWAAALAPRAWRRTVATAAGVSLTTGLAAPALAVDAGPVDTGPGWGVATHATVDAAPGWSIPHAAGAEAMAMSTDAIPGWLESPSANGPAEKPEDDSTAESPSTITVAAGDSLWDLTANLTGDDAAQVAAEWPLLYEANRTVIGDDPGVIEPGQVLVVPEELVR
ncbi:LysM peptidoglycan-binding domain-containing protein [Demequina sp. NBRC 110054]|uniref:LysM peptidoglycan-binding domain-containing protein n=1 Tax=Demequina sp. NBRC 110054 TaxID=1570343 RepID=UPI001177CA3A|nr:LysM peptidoglycan-binding domain-containing protein [Demequina sp. NBRC 110054]